MARSFPAEASSVVPSANGTAATAHTEPVGPLSSPPGNSRSADPTTAPCRRLLARKALQVDGKLVLNGPVVRLYRHILPDRHLTEDVSPRTAGIMPTPSPSAAVLNSENDGCLPLLGIIRRSA
jgi:hypothetical protein